MANWAAIANGIYKFAKGAKAAGEAAMQMAKDVDMAANKIIHAADAIGGRWMRVNDVAFKTARTMAMSREEAVKYNNALLKSSRALSSQFGLSYKQFDDFQKAYVTSTGRNIILSKNQQEQMSGLLKIAGEDAGRLVDEFDKVGVGVARATAYTGRLQERAKALGVNPAKATKMMADNIKLAASYSFKNGVADIEKMSMKASAMRMDMNAVMSASEKFADIEGAIGTSANIQMLGGSFAREFSNPMGAMYEAMADPAAFQERILRTVQGKGTYNAKTGAVEFDPVTMRMMRELAKNLGMTVDQITNPAMASVQNKKVEEELQSAGKWNQWSEVEQEAIKNLSRTNVNEETGKHFVTYLDESGNVVERNIEDLTREELQIAQDRQITEEAMFGDVQEIKDILKRTLDRARDTTSTREKQQGLQDLWDTGIVGGLQNLFMPKVSEWYNKLGNWLGKQFFSNGGIAKPVHAEFGTIVPGDSYSGDRVHAMVNSGEMILNPMQQKSMFSLISSLAATGGLAYGANKLGGKFGMKGVGSTMLLARALGGEDAGIKEYVEAHFLKKFIKNMLPFKKSIEGVSKTAEAATKTTSAFSYGLGKNVKNFINTVKSSSYNAKAQRFTTTAGKFKSASSVGGKFTQEIVKLKGFSQGLLKTSIKPSTAKAVEAGGKMLSNVGKVGGSVLKGAGKLVKPLGAVLAIGSAVNGISNAKSQYEAEVDKIESSNLTEYEKARAKDRATRAKNANVGSSVGGATGMAVGTAIGATLGSAVPVVGTLLGGALGGWLGEKAGSWIGKGIGGLFGGNEEKKLKEKEEKQIEADAIGIKTDEKIYNTLKSIDNKMTLISGKKALISPIDKLKSMAKMPLGVAKHAIGLTPIGLSIKTAELASRTIGLNKPDISSDIKPIVDNSNFIRVKPTNGSSDATNSTISVGKTDINLNVSGTIKLEGNGKSVDFDLAKLLDTPEFKRQLADIVSRRLNEDSNSGKRNMESERDNMANQYNKSGGYSYNR